MREMRVNRNGQHLRPNASKLRGLIGVTDNLRGADIGKIERIEHQDHVLAGIVFEADSLEAEIGHDGLCGEFVGSVAGHYAGCRVQEQGCQQEGAEHGGWI